MDVFTLGMVAQWGCLVITHQSSLALFTDAQLRLTSRT